MAIVSRKKNEIQCKVVYYGPGRGGKTTNLITIHKAVASKVRGQLISIHTAGDRTIFFDFMPMDLGAVKNMNIKISVYTVPGQVIYNDTRKVVLRGVDGIVFVADSLEISKRTISKACRIFKTTYGIWADNLRMCRSYCSTTSVI